VELLLSRALVFCLIVAELQKQQLLFNVGLLKLQSDDPCESFFMSPYRMRLACDIVLI